MPLRARADALTVAQKHLLEIAKALAIKPKVLILDEPTAALDQDATDMLFGRIRDVVKSGTAVIYITHRLAELRQIAQRVTVLRDGKRARRGARRRDQRRRPAQPDRRPRARSPPSRRSRRSRSQEIDFSVEGLSGDKFFDVSFEVAARRRSSASPASPATASRN